MLLENCPRCGSKIFSNANFCANCGLDLESYGRETENLEKSSTEIKPNDVNDKSAFELGDEPQKEAADSNLDTPISNEELMDNDAFKQDELEGVLIESSKSLTPLDENSGDDEPADEEIVIMPKGCDDKQVLKSEFVESANSEVKDDMSTSSKKTLSLKTLICCFIVSVLGIIGVLSLKLSTNESESKQKVKTEETVADSVAAAKSEEVKDVPKTEFEIPKQSGSLTDHAYHVIVASIGNYESAQRVAEKYNGYVIKDKINKVAVYRSLKREDAKLYADSVIRKQGKDAWIFEGPAKKK